MRKLTALIVLNLILASSVCGQVPNLPKVRSKEGTEQLAAEKTPTSAHELTAQDLETFLDGIVPLQLERDDIAGATVAVVKDGKLLFANMARFMMAHLQDGQLGDARILRPETARLMHSRLFALDEAANGMCYGFYEESRNGHRIIGHGGDTVSFHSDLHLIPDASVGVFVSHNSQGRGNPLPRTILWEALLARYFPYTPPTEPTMASAKEDARAVSGAYMLSRRSDASFLKAATLIGEFTVSPAEGETIEVAQLTGPNGKPKRWREVAPLTFIEVFSDRGNLWFHLIQMIGVLGAIGTLVVLYNAIQSWRNREKRIWSKLQATLFVLVCLGFLWFTFAGNLLHFNSNY